MLLEQHRLHVRQLDHAVDDGEADLGKFLRDLLDRVRLGEADADDRILAALGEAAVRLLELGLVGDLELGIARLGLVLELLGAVIDAFVERLVELAADVEDDRGLDVGRRRAGDTEDEAGECREQ